jgi:hypothetical protein
MARDLDLNITGNARRAQQALNDVATGTERAARITDQLSRSFDNLEDEANEAQRALDRVNDEIANNGPTAELNAELAQLQRRLSEISDERRLGENLRAQFRRSTAAAQQLDHQLADVRRELDRLNDEYAQGGDPAVLRRIQEQQRELQRLAGIRQRIAAEDEENQARLARMAEEALRAQRRREDEERRRSEEEDNRSFLRRLARRARAAGDQAGSGLQGAPVPPQALAVGAAIGASAAVPLLAAIGGALTGLAGFGVAGAGIAGAVMGDPEAFKADWTRATDSVKEQFLEATEVFTGPTLEAIRSIGPLVESWDLDEMFAGAAKFVPMIVKGVEGFATGVIRGVSAMVDKGEPAVEALSSGLAELGDAAGDAFEAIADGAEGGGEALRDVLFLTSDIIRGFGEIVGAAGKAYDFVHDHPVASAFMTMGASLPITLLDQFSDEVEQSAMQLDVAASSATQFASVQDLLAQASKRASDSIASELGILLSVDEATDTATESYKGLLETLKQNGYVLKGNSDKALENRDAIRETISAWEDEREASVAAGKGSAEATDAANAALLAHLVELRRVLAAHGANTAEVDEYIAAVKRASGLVLTTIFRNVYENVGTPNERQKTGHSRDIDQHVTGGNVRSTGIKLVGEQGPELRFMNRGEYIATAQQTKQLLSGSGGGGGGGNAAPPVIRVIVQYPDGRVIRDELVTTAANRGQTVGDYLGI